MAGYSEDKIEKALANFKMITTSEARMRKIGSSFLGSLVIALRFFFPDVVTTALFATLLSLSIFGYRTGSLNQ